MQWNMKPYTNFLYFLLTLMLVIGFSTINGFEKAATADTGIEESIAPDNSDGIFKLADDSTAVVSTYSELSSAVISPNIETILLDADITLTGVITIPTSKASLTIDGQGIYTLEQSRQSANTCIRTNSASNPCYRMQNLNFVGRDYYGVIYCMNSSGNVTIEIHNITYSGPQIVYNQYGSVNFSGINNITIRANATNSNPAHEVAEANRVSIAGNFNLTAYTIESNSFFWFLGSNPVFRIEDDAQVRFTTTTRRSGNHGFFNLDTALDFSVGKRASLELDITGYHALVAGTGQRFKTMTIEEDAWVKFSCAGGILLSGPCVVKERATFIFNQVNPASGSPNITTPMFYMPTRYTGGPILSFDNPKLVILSVEPSARPLFNFENTVNTIDISTTELHYWSNYGNAKGKLLPDRMWLGDNNTPFTATTANGVNWTIDGENVGFNNRLYLRTLQFGTTPFPLHPDEIWDYMEQIAGHTTPYANVYISYAGPDQQTNNLEGTADANGRFSIPCDPSTFDPTKQIQIVAVTEFIATQIKVPVHTSSPPTADPVFQVARADEPFTSDAFSLLTNIEPGAPGSVTATITSLPNLDTIGLSSALVTLTNAARKSSDITVPVFVIDSDTSIDTPPRTALRASDFMIELGEYPNENEDINEYIKRQSNSQAWRTEDGSLIPEENILVADTNLEASVGLHYAKLVLKDTSVERTIVITVYNASEWINVRIPTKMLFGTLDPYYNDTIISPRYEIENKSDRELQVVVGGFVVDYDDGVDLLAPGNIPGENSELKLDLKIDDSLIIENLFPFLGSPEYKKRIAILESGESAHLSFSGSYFGEYPEGVVLRPRYSIVWAFEALEEDDE